MSSDLMTFECLSFCRGKVSFIDKKWLKNWGLLIRGWKLCREDWYVCIFIDIHIAIVVYSRLSRSNTARGSCTGLVKLGPTKV